MTTGAHRTLTSDLDLDMADPAHNRGSDDGTKPPRILHICTRFCRGGSEQRIVDIVEATPDCEHHLLVGADSDVEIAKSRLPSVPVRHEPSLTRSVRPSQDLTALVRIKRELRSGDYDVVVTHQSKAGVLGRVAAHSAGRLPVVHSLSMANFGPGYGAIESGIFRTIERALAPWTHGYVVVGTDLVDRFARLGIPREKLSVVRSGIRLPPLVDDRAAIRRFEADRFGLPADRPWILYVGSLDQRKNVLALPIVLQQILQLSVSSRPFLVVAGAGPEEEELRSLVTQMGLDDDCRLLGHVDDPSGLFPAAEAVVLLSRAEGLPQVLVQAAAAGTPFVSTAVDGADELLALGASGHVIDQDDIVGAARGLLPYLRWPVQVRTPKIDLSPWGADAVRAGHRRAIRSALPNLAPSASEPHTHIGVGAQHLPRGAVIALIGSDGSGKSTVSRALVERLASQQPVVHLYLGSGDGPSSILRWPMKRIRRAVFGRKGTITRKHAVEERAPRAIRASRSLWALALAQEKHSKLRRAWHAADQGALVVCDRFPQAQVPGSTDGPLLDAWSMSSSRWRRLIARWEAQPYERAHRAQPDLVLRLCVDRHVAEVRRPDHDPEELNQRRLLVQNLCFDTARLGLVDLDANQPLDGVLAQALATIEHHLAPSPVARSPR